MLNYLYTLVPEYNLDWFWELIDMISKLIVLVLDTIISINFWIILLNENNDKEKIKEWWIKSFLVLDYSVKFAKFIEST